MGNAQMRYQRRFIWRDMHHACGRSKDHIVRNGEHGRTLQWDERGGRLPALGSWRSSNGPLQNSLVMEI